MDMQNFYHVHVSYTIFSFQFDLYSWEMLFMVLCRQSSHAKTDVNMLLILKGILRFYSRIYDEKVTIPYCRFPVIISS